MLAEARHEPAEERQNTPEPSADDYEEMIMACADKHLDAATDEVRDPMVHKAMVALICNNFLRFHNAMAAECLGDGNAVQAAAWSRDAGKFQAMMNILATVVCGENDFLACDD